MRRMLIVAAVLILAGCGKDSSGPSIPNLAGNWTYNTSNLTGAGLSCLSTGTTMVLTHSSSTAFTGTYSDGTLTCTSGGTPESFAIGNGTIVSGTVGQTAVAFDMDTQDWHNTGNVSGRSMSGTVHVVFSDGVTTFVLNGNFSASHQ